MRTRDLFKRRTVNVTQLRRNSSAILRRVEKGESFDIVRHGKLVARLGSVIPHWKRPTKPLVIPGVSVSKLIIEERQSGL